MTVDKDIAVKQDEISIKDLIKRFLEVFSYLRSQWLKLLLAGILGGAVGFYLAYKEPMKYTAKLSFVMEESKGGAGGLASLAGQFGLDLGGSGGGGLFSGDNILFFLKSQSLVRETLLSQYGAEPKTLADQYAISNNLKKRWEQGPDAGPVTFYRNDDQQLNRKQDSLLQYLSDYIINNELSVSRPDKKASIIEVKTTMRDEQLSKLFCDRLVALALDRYVSSKVKVKAGNVKMLQRRADSLEALLNTRTFTAAASQQSLLDVNPGLRQMAAAPEIRTREKMTASAVFAEVVKNLELAKVILNQETPTIEVVDQSSFPLKKEKPSKRIYMIKLSIVFALLTALLLLGRRWWVKQIRS